MLRGLNCIMQSQLIIECSHSDLLFSRCTFLACKNIHFSSLFTAGDVLHGGASATQRQKFHNDDANQCLHNKFGSHWVPINLSNFTCLLVSFGKVSCSSANELHQNSMLLLEKTIFHKHCLFCQRLIQFFAFTFDLCGLLSFVRHS